MMIDIYVDKLYKYERKEEPCFIGIPVKKGMLHDITGVTVYQKDHALPIQKSNGTA